MPAFGEGPLRGGHAGVMTLTRPAASLAAAADALAGYVVASPAFPREDEALAVVPFIFASAGLLTAAGNLFAHAFRRYDRDARSPSGLASLAERARSDCERCGPNAGGSSSPAVLTRKRVFLLGAALALGGVFAAMGAALTAGNLPVYIAALLFLVSWARAGKWGHDVTSPLVTTATFESAPLVRTAGLEDPPVSSRSAGRASLPGARAERFRAPGSKRRRAFEGCGPNDGLPSCPHFVSAGLMRALALALGMSAHSEIVYLAPAGAILAPGLFFAYGALAAVVAEHDMEGSLGAGGKRYLLLGALAGMLAVFGGAAVWLSRTALSRIVVMTGAVFLAARGSLGVRSLLPADVRRFGEGALLAGFFLDSGLCFGRWEATGAVLALGSFAVALVVPSAMMIQGRRARASAAGRID